MGLKGFVVVVVAAAAAAATENQIPMQILAIVRFVISYENYVEINYQNRTLIDNSYSFWTSLFDHIANINKLVYVSQKVDLYST